MVKKYLMTSLNLSRGLPIFAALSSIIGACLKELSNNERLESLLQTLTGNEI